MTAFIISKIMGKKYGDRVVPSFIENFKKKITINGYFNEENKYLEIVLRFFYFNNVF